MISNYSHDHIALDTMNIMANGQYIDQIMTNNQFYIFILTPKVSRQVLHHHPCVHGFAQNQNVRRPHEACTQTRRDHTLKR